MMSDEKERDSKKRKRKKPVEDIEDIDESLISKKPNPHRRKKISKASEDLIRDALESHLEYHAVKNINSKKDLHFLTSVIDEYLENFLILGYDYEGESVQLISASNQQQSDALGTSVHRFLMQNLKGGAGPEVF